MSAKTAGRSVRANRERIRAELKDFVYRAYERRLAGRLPPDRVPRHVGVILDGNRRWAKAAGSRPEDGHQAGADKIHELLSWCAEARVEVVTLWLLSTDNLARPAAELEPLLRIIERTVAELAAANWRVHPVGAVDLLPTETARVLKAAADATVEKPG